MFKTLSALFGLVILVSCQQATDGNGKKERLLETDREFSRYSIERGTFEAFYHFMDEGGIVLPRFAPPIKGKESYRQLFERQPDTALTTRLEWEPDWAEVSEAGDLGYTFGRYTRTVTNEADSVKVTKGYYVTIWKKQEDGSWKFVFDTGNEIPSAEK